MNAVVNGRFLSRQVTGVERYGREILRRLAGSRALGGQLRLVQPEGSARGAPGHAWEQLWLPGLLRRDEILWSPTNTGPLGVASQVLTLHDLSFLEHPEWYAPGFVRWYRLFLPALIRRVQRVVVPSEHVRRKVQARFGLSAGRLCVAPGGVDLDWFRPAPQPRYGSLEGYLLFVGSLQPRKNLGRLIEAWQQISPRFPGVCLAISGAEGPVFRKAALPPGVERVRYLGYVPEAQLPELYAGALALVYPSLDEGFGLPALEAMACRIPVIASNAGALPEVVGDTGLLVDPDSSQELAQAIERCLSDPALQRELAERGFERASRFSWEYSAEIIWEALQACP